MLDRAEFAKFWERSHAEGGWSAAWAKAVDGLTPQQAAWKPAPERHSIWQIVNHISFWREEVLRRAAGAPSATEEVVEKNNWLAPDRPTDDAWRAAKDRFRESHRTFRNGVLNPATPLEGALDILGHDFYHVGQVMLLRALQGLPPVV